jgi:hypothetical protein
MKRQLWECAGIAVALAVIAVIAYIVSHALVALGGQ